MKDFLEEKGPLHIIIGAVNRHVDGARSYSVADEKEAGKKKGPKGGVKHTPGRGHDRRSAPFKKKHFRRTAERIRREKEELARQLWKEWDEMSPEQRKLLGPKGEPKLPRPKNEN
jgi:hypothetical protein